MLRTLKALYNDENGFIVSAELVLVLTIGVLAMVVGLHSVSKSVANELNDLASAFGAINQSFSYNGLSQCGHSKIRGSGFRDGRDICDCTIIVQDPPRVKVDRSGLGSEAN